MKAHRFSEFLKEREERFENPVHRARVNFISSIIQGVVFIGGCAIVWIYSGWQLLLGIILMLWMNNMDFKRKN